MLVDRVLADNVYRFSRERRTNNDVSSYPARGEREFANILNSFYYYHEITTATPYSTLKKFSKSQLLPPIGRLPNDDQTLRNPESRAEGSPSNEEKPTRRTCR
jgi:hypothetical protein